MYEVKYRSYAGIYNPKLGCVEYKFLGEWKYMQKTKEVVGWSYNKNIDDFERGIDSLRVFIRTPDNFHEINASTVKAVVELPEKKIELTESQFDEVAMNTPMINFGHGMNAIPNTKGWFEEVKRKLFGTN